jgi:hypothetical protein
MFNGKRMRLLVGTVLMGGSLAVATFAADTTLEGTVTDAMCGATHKGANAAACMKGCVGKGSKYGLVVGDKVYELTGQEDALAKIGPAKAKVTGSVDGMKVEVKSVTPAS